MNLHSSDILFKYITNTAHKAVNRILNCNLSRDLHDVYMHVAYLLPENRLSLTTKTLLFPVITSSTLRGASFLAFLVLRHFVVLVYLAFFAKSTSLFRNVNLKGKLTEVQS